ncbi:MAG: anti-sigma factor [Chloroflexi bacterium]|nr:anti-sigma factor [Chloroflexota bacterium]
MECAQVAELTAAYALAALPEGERREVEAHVAACPECRARLAQEQALVAVLPLAVEQRAPPARLKTRLLQAARADLATRERQPDTPAHARRRGGPRSFFATPLPYAAAAVLLLFAVGGLAAWGAQLRSLNRQADAELARLRSSTRILAAQGTEAAPGASGQVLQLGEQQRALLLVRGLPTLPPDKTYQVWLLKDGKPVGAGLFQVEAGREAAAVVTGDLSRYDLLAVTVEPAGGLPLPSGAIVLKAGL